MINIVAFNYVLIKFILVKTPNTIYKLFNIRYLDLTMSVFSHTKTFESKRKRGNRN